MEMMSYAVYVCCWCRILTITVFDINFHTLSSWPAIFYVFFSCFSTFIYIRVCILVLVFESECYIDVIIVIYFRSLTIYHIWIWILNVQCVRVIISFFTQIHQLICWSLYICTQLTLFLIPRKSILFES